MTQAVAQSPSLPQSRIMAQRYKFIFVLLAWPLYLFFLPLAWARLGAWTLFLLVFPGIYLFTWAGYLMHESWHKYIPNWPSNFFYHAFAYGLLTDPQVYHMLHGTHHAKVNTWEDMEFHPLGRIENVHLRRLYNWAEVLLGVAFLEIVALFVVPRHPEYKAKYSRGKLALSVLAWSVFLGGLGAASAYAFGLSAPQVILPYLLQIWLGSFILHQSQLVEHGNLIVPGDFHERNIKTHNLSSKTLAGKLFLFLTHNDSREHVLHHTLVRVYSRPFPGAVPLPENAVVITFGDYLKILGGILLGYAPEAEEIH